MKASILITAYNYERYVEECILSCLGQKGISSYEVILVNDGSTDRTLEIAQRYQDRIRILSGPNQGLESACNQAIELARGEFVVRVDADDTLKPDHLRLTIPVLEREPVAFVYTEYEIVDKNGAVLRKVQLPDFDRDEIRQRGDFLATGTLYRRAILQQLGLYSTKKKNCGLENYELVLKILHHDMTGICLHENLFTYRHHGANMSELRRADIIAYGRSLEGNWGLKKYRTNQHHPYGLRLDS